MGKKIKKIGRYRSVRHTLNTIAGGFLGNGETISARRRLVFQILTIKGSPTSSDFGEIEALKHEITFFERDTASNHPLENKPMLIIVRCDDWEIKRVLVD